MPISEAYCIDCMEYMKSFPDKYFDLAVVDPPYGIGQNWRKDTGSKFYRHESSYKNESIPGAEYFTELFRVSKNQIIWGGNYYTEFLPARNSWIVWDKQIDYPTQHLSEAELAWTSFNVPVRVVSLIWNGCCRCEKRSGIHPHEKPKQLYKWIFDNYFNAGGGRILDTHLGSGSSRIVAYQMGYDFYGCEIDPGYFKDSQLRFERECNGSIALKSGEIIKQVSLFDRLDDYQ